MVKIKAEQFWGCDISLDPEDDFKKYLIKTSKLRKL